MIYRMTKLMDICEIQGGYAFKSNSFQSEGIPVIRIGDIEDYKIELKHTTVFVEHSFLDRYSNFIINKDDILIALSGATTGKYGLYRSNNPALLNQRVGRIIPNKSKVYHKFIYYYMNILKDRILKKAGGAAQPNISPKDIKEFEIPLPPLETQKKIVDILDKAQEIIDKRKEQIEKLDEFIQSVFLDMFGDPIINPKKWGLKKLGEIAKITMGQSPKGSSYNNEGNGTPLLNGPTEFGEKYPVEKQWTIEPKKLCETGDILFCVRGATAGRMNFANKEFCIGRGLAAIKAHNKSNQNYIYLILKNMYYHFQNTSDGSTFINIGKDKLSDIPIPITDDELQNKFAAIVEKTEQQKELLQKSLTEMENNFNSLMHRAFKGDLF